MCAFTIVSRTPFLRNVIKSIKFPPKLHPKSPRGPKTAPKQKTLQNRSKSAKCEHTLDTCSSHSRFFKIEFKKMLLVRTRLQTVAFFWWTFDFESGFAVHFESITKPQREAQKSLWEHTILTLSRVFKAFSKSAHKIHYKTRYFWTWSARSPIHSIKTEVKKSLVAKPEREHEFGPKRL